MCFLICFPHRFDTVNVKVCILCLHCLKLALSILCSRCEVCLLWLYLVNAEPQVLRRSYLPKLVARNEATTTSLLRSGEPFLKDTGHLKMS